ncbi:plasmid stabilization protein [Candidatus Gracilibacteria bacterium]|nr:plasmid stabilization protein [Candidatus Gracilibacteria bacterium]
MDKITKFLLKLSLKEKDIILLLIDKLLSGNFNGLDIKKLIGEENLFRVRKGSIRIIFYKKENEIKLIDINYRGQIYK